MFNLKPKNHPCNGKSTSHVVAYHTPDNLTHTQKKCVCMQFFQESFLCQLFIRFKYLLYSLGK